MSAVKPQLACDYDEAKLKFPLMGMPKIDGVRGINLDGTMTGRSLKTHKNKHTTALFSKPEFLGCDGEIAAGDWTGASLCRDTTSAIGTIEGTPEVVWWLFDCLHTEVLNAAYKTRYKRLETLVEGLALPHVKIVPVTFLYDTHDVNEFEAKCLAEGFEGVILRDPEGLHKSGRATVKVGSYLRIKRFSDAEAVVISLDEMMKNNNEAKVNELGHTERSSHQENKEGKGMVGNLVCKDIESGTIISVSAGSMSHEDRKHYFENQEKIIGKIIKYKSFRHGVKDLPRFPTFLSIRAESDMS
jgi:DNA ligase-1